MQSSARHQHACDLGQRTPKVRVLQTVLRHHYLEALSIERQVLSRDSADEGGRSHVVFQAGDVSQRVDVREIDACEREGAIQCSAGYGRVG